MQNMNRTLHIGAIARTPELKYSPTGTPILVVVLGGTDHLRDHNLTPLLIPWYHRFTFMGKAAETLEPLIRESVGKAALIEGRLDYREFQNAGETHKTLDIKGLRFEHLERQDDEITQDKQTYRLLTGKNQVQISGIVGSPPISRELPQGGVVTHLNLGNQEVWTQNNTEHKKTHWVPGTTWDSLAEYCRDSIYKNDLVWAEGRLYTESWMDDRQGKKRFENKIEIHDLEIIRKVQVGA